MPALLARTPTPVARAPSRSARRLSRAAAPLGVLAVALAAFAYVGAVDPHQPGHYPACPLLSFAGVHCPGCGGLRSAHAVAHGDLRGALHTNALAVAGYAVFAATLLHWLLRALRDRPALIPRLSAPARWGLATVVLGFTVFRNLPVGTFLAA